MSHKKVFIILLTVVGMASTLSFLSTTLSEREARLKKKEGDYQTFIESIGIYRDRAEAIIPFQKRIDVSHTKGVLQVVERIMSSADLKEKLSTIKEAELSQ